MSPVFQNQEIGQMASKTPYNKEKQAHFIVPAPILKLLENFQWRIENNEDSHCGKSAKGKEDLFFKQRVLCKNRGMHCIHGNYM